MYERSISSRVQVSSGNKSQVVLCPHPELLAQSLCTQLFRTIYILQRCTPGKDQSRLAFDYPLIFERTADSGLVKTRSRSCTIFIYIYCLDMNAGKIYSVSYSSISHIRDSSQDSDLVQSIFDIVFMSLQKYIYKILMMSNFYLRTF